MKNKLKVNIYNRTYNLLSEETQGYTDKLAAVISSKITGLLKAIPSLSVQDAAVLTSLDCLDELNKANQNIENIRTQIKDYVDDAGKARAQADEAHREIRELKERITELEAELNERTVVKREPADEVINANDIISQDIRSALERPIHSAQRQNKNGNYIGTVNYKPENGGSR